MLQHYIIGVGAFVLLSAAWLGVQRAWRDAFPEAGDDPDALAGRSGCHGCGNPGQCSRGQKSGACEFKEK
jgi:hypothetical protein